MIKKVEKYVEMYTDSLSCNNLLFHIVKKRWSIDINNVELKK